MKTLNAAASIVLLALFAAHRAAAALPDGYVELRAIQGDGAGAYIATGYIPKPNIDRIEAKFLTGRVYEFPKKDMLVHSTGITFVNVPVYDSPCLLAERKVALP